MLSLSSVNPTACCQPTVGCNSNLPFSKSFCFDNSSATVDCNNIGQKLQSTLLQLKNWSHEIGHNFLLVAPFWTTFEPPFSKLNSLQYHAEKSSFCSDFISPWLSNSITCFCILAFRLPKVDSFNCVLISSLYELFKYNIVSSNAISSTCQNFSSLSIRCFEHYHFTFDSFLRTMFCFRCFRFRLVFFILRTYEIKLIESLNLLWTFLIFAFAML